MAELIAHHRSRQIQCERAHFFPQRHERRLALGLNLGLCVLGDALRVGFCLLAHFLQNRLTFTARLVANTRGFVACVVEKLGVFLQRFLGFFLGGLGVFDTTFDGVGALIQHLVESGQDQTPEQQQHQGERNDRPDNVINRRQKGVLGLTLCRE